MPFIDSKITLKISEEKKEKIKSELGKIISVIPGKSESWLMVGINDDYRLYFKGEKKEKAAFVEVKIYGSADKSAKDKVTSLICSLYEKELDIPKDSVYITFQEIGDWGWNGGLF